MTLTSTPRKTITFFIVRFVRQGIICNGEVTSALSINTVSIIKPVIRIRSGGYLHVRPCAKCVVFGSFILKL
jgi:hypothetical protein